VSALDGDGSGSALADPLMHSAANPRNKRTETIRDNLKARFLPSAETTKSKTLVCMGSRTPRVHGPVHAHNPAHVPGKSGGDVFRLRTPGRPRPAPRRRPSGG